MELSWKQVGAWRARRHGLEQRRPAAQLLDVVGQLCGLHAQVMSSAELTAWARLEDLAPGWLTPVLCVGGRIEGVWRWTRKGKRLEVEIEPFGRLAKPLHEAAASEAERLAAFLGGELELRWI